MDLETDEVQGMIERLRRDAVDRHACEQLREAMNRLQLVEKLTRDSIVFASDCRYDLKTAIGDLLPVLRTAETLLGLSPTGGADAGT